MRRNTVLWLLAALLGLLIVAATTWATSQLTSQRIGISSEPLSAGSRLAPPVSREQAQPRRRSQPARTITVRTVTVPAPPPAAGGGQSAPTTPVRPAPSTTVEREAAPAPRTGSEHDEKQSSGTDGGGRSGERGGRERDD